MTLIMESGKPRLLAYDSKMRQDLKLLEVDEELLAELTTKGLCFKGTPNDEVVLCSDHHTFAVKKVDTTNLVLLVHGDQTSPSSSPPSSSTRIVATAVASSHLELTRAAPRLALLDIMLSKSPYTGNTNNNNSNDNEMDIDTTTKTTPRPTWTQLLQAVQASPAELSEALDSMGALCIDGGWCIMDAEYIGTLLEVVILTAIQHDWSDVNNGSDSGWVIPGSKMGTLLEEEDGYNPRVTLHCLKLFGKPVVAVDEEDGERWYRLDTEAVCRYFGIKLLKERTPPPPLSSSKGGGGEMWKLEEFIHAWQAAVPEGMTVNVNTMLQGHALTLSVTTGPAHHSSNTTTMCIKYFSVKELPKDAERRFKAMFEERARWEWGDMEAYVKGLEAPGQSVEALLMKYARASQMRPNDPVTYSAR